MKRTSWPVIALALSVPLVAASVQAASAATVGHAGKNNPAPAAAASTSSKQPTAEPLALTRYRQVSSASFVDPANSQVTGSVTCPGRMKVLSGGAIIGSTSVSENLNSSLPTPDGHSWEVWVNNTSGSDGTFVVYAVCARGITNYSIVNSGVSPDPPGLNESNQIQAVCPRGSVVYGGGGFISSSSPLTMMAQSEPGFDNRTWFAAYNNRSSATTNDETYAVCGKRQAGYVHVHGPGTNVAPGTQGGASVSCPSGDVVLGGGGGPSVFWGGLTDMNSSGPASSTTWSYWENNNSAQTFAVEASAVCATFAA
jgi:hypothetical protein